ncbi:hypothetical protein [Alkaliphilus sp. B6464]|uniref:hypothetical protein n=1 Tax=Alkaliphilus sp. B6464 TaxID=2731219 RepID=UPI001BABF4DD|nr:hypothetical protein [Alkaliphilus sp. B6464]QUH21764.1 hypothetical protein HYG84_17665 [Alkaliphilus sp. B6464]
MFGMNLMEVVTIQSQEVLDIINKQGYYEASNDILSKKLLYKNYILMKNIMNDKFRTKFDTLPI